MTCTCEACHLCRTELTRLRRVNAGLVAALTAYVEHAQDESERLPCCQKILDQAVAALTASTER